MATHARSTPHGRVLVAGAGALGLVFGGLLRRAGYPVALLGRAAHLDAISRTGLHIDGLWGRHCVGGFELCDSHDALDGDFEAILITVKSYDTRAMAAAVCEHLAAGGVVVSLQNGLGNLEAIAEVAGIDRVLGGRVIFGARSDRPGAVRVTVYAEPVLLGPLRHTEHLVQQAQAWAAACRAAAIPTEYCDDIVAALWGKVLYNAALNPLGALLGVHYGALTQSDDTRAIMDRVIAEAFAVACAEGVRLPWPSPQAYAAAFYGRLVPSTFDHRSSMLQDLERGRRTEVDAITGEIWRRGAQRGIATPTAELMTRLVHSREAMGRGERRCS